MHSPHTWIVDSGAIDHIDGSLSLFFSITKYVSVNVSLPNGQFAYVTHIGSVQISLDLVLQQVLFVSSFTFNLIFTNKLNFVSHIRMIFLSEKCFTWDLHVWRTTRVADRKGELYSLLVMFALYLISLIFPFLQLLKTRMLLLNGMLD